MLRESIKTSDVHTTNCTCKIEEIFLSFFYLPHKVKSAQHRKHDQNSHFHPPWNEMRYVKTVMNMQITENSLSHSCEVSHVLVSELKRTQKIQDIPILCKWKPVFHLKRPPKKCIDIIYLNSHNACAMICLSRITSLHFQHFYSYCYLF